MHSPQPNGPEALPRFDRVGRFFCGKVYSWIAIRRATGGAEGLLWSMLGLPPHDNDDDGLQPVDSIDIIIVGLGLILVILVLLRR